MSNIDWNIVKETIIPILSLFIAGLSVYASIIQTKLSSKLESKRKWIEDFRNELAEFLVTSDLAVSSYKQYYHHLINTKNKEAENKYFYSYEDALAKKSLHYFKMATYFDLKVTVYGDLNLMLNELNILLMGDNIKQFIYPEKEAHLFILFDKIGRKANEVIRFIEKK